MTYADAPECGNTVQESVIEMLLQELERRAGSLAKQVGDLHNQFELVLMDKSPSVGRDESPSEKLPAHSPLAKRLEILIDMHREIAYQLDSFAQEAEV